MTRYRLKWYPQKGTKVEFIGSKEACERKKTELEAHGQKTEGIAPERSRS